jgi:iron-sulfur cluster assembly protein
MTDTQDPQPIISITPFAAAQIRLSADQGGLHRLPLRIVPTRNEDGSIDYRMGFDERSVEDLLIRVGDVSLVISPADKPLLAGAELDFVEINPGESQFIFKNPNDATYRPPQD